MIIVEITGGLGNQMFQFALYSKLKFSFPNEKVKVDLSFYETHQKLRRFELDFFDVEYEKATKDEVRRMRGYVWTDGRIKRFYYKTKYRNIKAYTENVDLGFQKEVLHNKNVYLSGYWQCENYFLDIRDYILQQFSYPIDVLNENDKKTLAMILGNNAVGIHVRRGDYLLNDNESVYGNICTKEYYKKAIEYIRRNTNNPVFFLFSDDIDWVMENIYEDGMIPITFLQQNTSNYLDMFYMSQCKHNIIANSSFSWWGAWLNTNKYNITITPAKWFNNHTTTDMICNGWVRI